MIKDYGEKLKCREEKEEREEKIWGKRVMEGKKGKWKA